MFKRKNKKGLFGLAIYIVPSLILLALVLIFFSIYFFTDISKPEPGLIESGKYQDSIELLNFLKTSVQVNEQNITMVDVIALKNKDLIEEKSRNIIDLFCSESSRCYWELKLAYPKDELNIKSSWAMPSGSYVEKFYVKEETKTILPLYNQETVIVNLITYVYKGK